MVASADRRSSGEHRDGERGNNWSMGEPAKRLIDAWTLDEAQVAAREGVRDAEAVVTAATAANAGQTNEAAQILHRAMPHCEDIRLLFLGFQFFFRTGDHATAEVLTERRLAIAELAGASEAVARACTNLGLVHLATGRHQSALVHCQRAVDIDERLGNTRGLARDLGNLANVYEAAGDYASAERLNQRSLAIAQDIGDESIAAGKLANLGDIAIATGRPEQAQRHWTHAAALFTRLGEQTLAEKYLALAGSPSCTSR